MFVAEPTAALVAAMLIVTPARSRMFDVVEIDVFTDLVGPAPKPGVHGSITILQMAIDDSEGAVLRKLISIVIGDHQLQADHSAGRGP
jgi:branched-chain amino acid transport system substrate-binding protein